MHTPLLNEPPVRRSALDGSTGAALLQRYRLDREVSRTESGVLYDAVSVETGAPVSIEIANDLDDDARVRFERDAMIAQRLDGEHVLHVIEAGALVDGTPYVVREPALGSVAADVEMRGPLPTAEAVALALEVCEALAEAHTRGMAHGDVRGETVLLARDGVGNPIAKLRWTSKAKAEGAAREDVARDIAAVALLVRFLVTGQTDTEDEAAKTLPSDLAHAVARATSSDDSVRFRNIGELAAALARYAPPGHSAAGNVARILSRAGIVGVSPAATFASTVSPAPVRPRVVSQPGLNDAWFEPRPSLTSLAPPPPRRRGISFALVSLLLLAGTLAATVGLWKSGNLPHWSGTGPTMDEGRMEPISRTTLTAADIGETTSITPPPALTNAPVLAPARPATIAPQPTAGTTEADADEVTETPTRQRAAATPPTASPRSERTDEGSSKTKSAPAADVDKAAEPWPGTGALPPSSVTTSPTETADPSSSPSPPSPTIPESNQASDPGF